MRRYPKSEGKSTGCPARQRRAFRGTIAINGTNYVYYHRSGRVTCDPRRTGMTRGAICDFRGDTPGRHIHCPADATEEKTWSYAHLREFPQGSPYGQCVRCYGLFCSLRCFYRPRVFFTPAVASFTSDDFNAYNLKRSIWTFTDPLGDATLSMTGTGTGNATALAGDTWRDERMISGRSGDEQSAPRILQPATNTDFVLLTKFDSGVSLAYQLQGVIVQQDANTLIRFDLSSPVRTPISLQQVLRMDLRRCRPCGCADTLVANNNDAPMYLRITRTGNNWEVSTSPDGSTFTTWGTFTLALTVTQVGALRRQRRVDPSRFYHARGLLL